VRIEMNIISEHTGLYGDIILKKKLWLKIKKTGYYFSKPVP
jgi:hypothetical protein